MDKIITNSITSQMVNEKLNNENTDMYNADYKLATNYTLSLIEAIRDPLFAISPAYLITDMNNASVIKTEVPKITMLGSSFADYFTEPEKVRDCCKEIFAKGYISDFPLILKDGQLADVLLSGSVYKDDSGQVVGAVLVARDITEQKRIEKEFIEAKVFAELTTVIAEEAKAKAESAAILAREAVKAKQQFLSNMSHEIRTPMNAIIGFTKVLLKTNLTANQREYLVAIKLSGDALIVLINDILDLAKVEAGKMVFEKTPFKLDTSSTVMLHLFERKIQEKNLKLVKEYDASIPKVLLGDPVRLHQIMINLLSNAVKFTSSGKIVVRIKLIKESEENVTISFSIADTGIGIEESKIDKIFENFQQASSNTSRLYGGTGLGLAIVKKLVESQGGEIKVKSKTGKGSVFNFTLNFQKNKHEIIEESETLELNPELKNIRVLAVEDMALNQLLMKTLLDDFGFERDLASNGRIAIEKMQNKKYDIILMDLQMPEMNGFEATEYIRNTMQSSIPIIALTADVTTVDLEKCKAVGMNDYLAKPVDEKLLYNKIINLVRKPASEKNSDVPMPELEETTITRCTNIDYLMHRTKSDPKLMGEVITLYLQQTPLLIKLMIQSVIDEDWLSLNAAAHKIIPSFAIVGINTEFEDMAKKIKDYSSIKQQRHLIPGLVLQVENICNQACIELKEDLNSIIKSVI